MRTLLILAAAAVSVPQLSFAASACGNNSLSAYILLGAGGCTIGSNTLSGFATLSGISGATAISPTGIALSPFQSGAGVGLTTTVNASSSAGMVQEALFTYRISGSTYSGSSISLAGSSESGDGAVTGLQNFCADGSFGPDGVSGCSGAPGSLLTLDGIQNTDAASFSAAGFLNVTNDLTIDGGLAGSASAGSLSNEFSSTPVNSTPEPGTILLTAAGLSVAMGIRRRFTKRICS